MTKVDYKHVNDDYRRGVVNNNIQQIEQEHASTALALEMAKKMVTKAGGDEAVEAQYKAQRDQLEARLKSLTDQLSVWNEILGTIPKVTDDTALGSDKK